MREVFIAIVLLLVGLLGAAWNSFTTARMYHTTKPSHAANDDPAAHTVSVPIQNDATTDAVSLKPQPSTNFAEVSTTPVHQSQLPANDPPPAPARVYAPAAPSGRYELRNVRTGFRSWQPQWVWVSNQPQRTTYGAVYGGCASGRCGR